MSKSVLYGYTNHDAMEYAKGNYVKLTVYVGSKRLSTNSTYNK